MSDRKTLFKNGSFTLHSGAKSNFLIDADALTDDDLDTLALIVHGTFKFKHVIGIPRGGLRFASALKKHQNNNVNTTLIVDDVLTTGRSMVEMKELIKGPVIGIVIFARDTPPDWITPIFQMGITI